MMRTTLLGSLALLLCSSAMGQEVLPHSEPPPARIEPVPEPPPTLESVPPLPHLTTPACLETLVYRLKHAPVADVAARVDEAFRAVHAIEPAVRGLVIDAKAVLIPEPVSNSLIVAALPEFMPELRSLIEKADRPPRQYVVQARMTRTDGNGRRMVIAEPKLATIAGRPVTVAMHDSHGRGYELELVIEEAGRSDAGEPVESSVQNATAVNDLEKEPAHREWREITVKPKVHFETESTDEPEERIERKLQEKTSLEFDRVPLKDAVRQVADRAEINVVIDSLGLDEAGVPAEKPVSVDARSLPLREALRRVLEPMGLGYRVEDEVLKITSRMRSRGPLETVTYPVADLAVRMTDGRLQTDLRSLIETIETQVHPESWDKNGGPATARPFEPKLSLVVRQSQQGHERIRDLLDELRREKEQEPVPFDVQATRHVLPAFVTEGAAEPTASEPARILRAYVVNDLLDSPAGETDFAWLVDELRTSCSPATWAAGSIQPDAATGSLIVRNTQEAHVEIERNLGQIRRMKDRFAAQAREFRPTRHGDRPDEGSRP